MNKLRLIKQFSRYVYPYIGRQVFIFVLMLIGGVGALASPYFMKIMIDQIFPSGNFGQLVSLLGWLLIIYVVRILSNIITDVMYTQVSTGIVTDLRRDVLDSILSRPLAFFKSARSGEVLYTVMNDVENIQTAISSLLLSLINNCITVIGIVVMLGILNLRLTLISLTILPFILYSIRRFTPHLQNSYRCIQEIQEKLSTQFLEGIRNIRVIKSYGTLQHEHDNLQNLQGKLRNAYQRNSLIASSNSNITSFFVAVGPLLVLIYGGSNVFKGVMTIGSLIAFIQYLNRLYSPTISIMESYNHLNRSLVSMGRVQKYLDEECKGFPLKAAEGGPYFTRLSLDKVCLQIGHKEVLKDVDLEFEKGKIYGIVGPSGAGKSSLLNLICGFVRQSSGSILIDGEYSIAEIPAWFHVIGLVEKENQLFSGSIRDNIMYGSFGKGEEEVNRACQHAAFSEVASQLTNQYDTEVNETGTLLSDGQKQRISISRAFLKHPQILIFDESTAALDLALEQRILSNLRKFYHDCIVIIITHRRSTLEQFDHVYALEDGQIVKAIEPCASAELP